MPRALRGYPDDHRFRHTEVYLDRTATAYEPNTSEETGWKSFGVLAIAREGGYHKRSVRE